MLGWKCPHLCSAFKAASLGSNQDIFKVQFEICVYSGHLAGWVSEAGEEALSRAALPWLSRRPLLFCRSAERRAGRTEATEACFLGRASIYRERSRGIQRPSPIALLGTGWLWNVHRRLQVSQPFSSAGSRLVLAVQGGLLLLGECLRLTTAMQFSRGEPEPHCSTSGGGGNNVIDRAEAGLGRRRELASTGSGKAIGQRPGADSAPRLPIRTCAEY